jgi:hypothetical protein
MNNHSYTVQLLSLYNSTVSGRGWISTIFNSDHPKTVLRMQSPSYICGRFHAMNLLLSPWILLLELQQSYCYFLGNVFGVSIEVSLLDSKHVTIFSGMRFGIRLPGSRYDKKNYRRRLNQSRRQNDCYMTREQ